MKNFLFTALLVCILPFYVFADTYDKNNYSFIKTSSIYKSSKTKGIINYNNIFMTPVINRKADAAAQEYYKNNNFKKSSYNNIKPDLLEKLYYEHSVLWGEISYKKDKTKGIVRFFARNGRLGFIFIYKK